MGCTSSLLLQPKKAAVNSSIAICAKSITQVVCDAVPDLPPDVVKIVHGYCIAHLFVGCSQCHQYDVVPVCAPEMSTTSTTTPRHVCSGANNNREQKDSFMMQQQNGPWRLASTGWNGVSGSQMFVYTCRQEWHPQGTYATSIGFARSDEPFRCVSDVHSAKSGPSEASPWSGLELSSSTIESVWIVLDVSLSFVWTPEYLFIFCWSLRQVLTFDFAKDAKWHSTRSWLFQNLSTPTECKTDTVASVIAKDKPERSVSVSHEKVTASPAPPSVSVFSVQPLASASPPASVLPAPSPASVLPATAPASVLPARVSASPDPRHMRQYRFAPGAHGMFSLPRALIQQGVAVAIPGTRELKLYDMTQQCYITKVHPNQVADDPYEVDVSLPFLVTRESSIQQLFSVRVNWSRCWLTCRVEWGISPHAGCAVPSWMVDARFLSRRVGYNDPHSMVTLSLRTSNDPRNSFNGGKPAFAFYVWTEYATLRDPFNDSGKWMPQWATSLQNSSRIGSEQYVILRETAEERSAFRVWFDYVTLRLCLSAVVLHVETDEREFVVAAATFSSCTELDWKDVLTVKARSLPNETFHVADVFLPSSSS